MDFELAYREFVSSHFQRRSGAAASRLADGLGHAEKLFLQNVWWPMFYHFDGLHPEYQIRDVGRGWRYIDFAYIRGYYRLALEIDGYASHRRDATRYDHSEECRRQNALVLDGWRLLRFAYDDVHDHPEICAQMIQAVIGRWSAVDESFSEATIGEREMLRYTAHSPRPITPKEVAEALNISVVTARRHMRKLVKMHWLEPVGGQKRVRAYRIHPSRNGTMI
ncbi:helix-turn-helix domain-containing protein [Alicyclobacillus sp. ALC3]|uniref:helix-turn-helix domain-containing protein n=1 Tax=Alicyclobacillus sp. ALC3 TaxID=2796143 RepID=UPI002379D83A|nr:helix-turn-helix domain-containing protein [Alicyclobacillus sp. ALC3]WDL99043.1 winged helix-turn-helix transcriptional regulator [Alicyclobacillus sp. ALC3]